MQSALPLDPVVPSPFPAIWNGRIPRDLAEQCAQTYLNLLTPVCCRIQIAGSLRRLKELVHDIELVAIESSPGAVNHALCQYQYSRRLSKFWHRRGEKYLRFSDLIVHPSSLIVSVDLFLSQPEYFGYTLFIRTGSTDWNKAALFYLNDRGYHIKNNMIFPPAGGHYLQTPEESDFFQILGIPYVEPWNRNTAMDFRRALRR